MLGETGEAGEGVGGSTWEDISEEVEGIDKPDSGSEVTLPGGVFENNFIGAETSV